MVFSIHGERRNAQPMLADAESKWDRFGGNRERTTQVCQFDAPLASFSRRFDAPSRMASARRMVTPYISWPWSPSIFARAGFKMMVQSVCGTARACSATEEWEMRVSVILRFGLVLITSAGLAQQPKAYQPKKTYL